MTGFDGSSVRHGTQSGWSLHKKRGERPCDPCYQAKQSYDKRRKAAPESVQHHRDFARAQSRAEGRLRNLYPDVWRVLYAEELARIKAER